MKDSLYLAIYQAVIIVFSLFIACFTMRKIPNEFSLFFEMVNVSLIACFSIGVKFIKYLKPKEG